MNSRIRLVAANAAKLGLRHHKAIAAAIIAVPTVAFLSTTPEFKEFNMHEIFTKFQTIAHADSKSDSDDFDPDEDFDASDDLIVNNIIIPTRTLEAKPTDLQGPVKILVATNFASVAMDPTKDVFVEFFSPNCQLCTSCAYVLDALAEAFHDVPTIVIAKTNGVSNYIPGLLGANEENAFPNMKLYPAGEAKCTSFANAVKKTEEVRQYIGRVWKERQALRKEIKQKRSKGDTTAALPVVTVSDLKMTRDDVEPVGISMPMTRTAETELMWVSIITFIHQNATHKFDKQVILDRLAKSSPALVNRIATMIESTLPVSESAINLAPCGAKWKALSKNMLLQGVGASTRSQLHESIRDYEDCIVSNKEKELAFWADMSRQAQVVGNILERKSKSKEDDS